MNLQEAYDKAISLKTRLEEKGYGYPHVGIYLNWYGSEMTVYISVKDSSDLFGTFSGKLVESETLFDRAYAFVDKAPLVHEKRKQAFQEKIGELQQEAAKLGYVLNLAEPGPVKLAS